MLESSPAVFSIKRLVPVTLETLRRRHSVGVPIIMLDLNQRKHPLDPPLIIKGISLHSGFISLYSGFQFLVYHPLAGVKRFQPH